MASTLLCLAVLVVTGTLLRETSAIKVRDAIQSKDIDLWEESKEALAGGYSTVRFNLAPSFGRLDSKSLKMLDKSLKVMMGGILKLDLKDRYTWKDIKSTLDNSPLTKERPQQKHFKADRIHFKSIKVLGIGQSKTKRRYMIRTWFTNLIENVDILKDTNINLDKIVDVVTKFSVNMWTKLFTVRTRKVALMDLGILRFPDISHPFITLYRIQLLGKCTYKTYIFYQEESSDVIGLFNKEVYYPDRNYIEKLSGGLAKELIREVEDIFSDQ